MNSISDLVQSAQPFTSRNALCDPSTRPMNLGMLGGLGNLAIQPTYGNALAPRPKVRDQPYYLETFAVADFGEELQKPYWTIDDGVPILLGIQPIFAQLWDLEPNRYRDKVATEGMRLRDLVLMAQEVGDLQERFRPVQFINWALGQHIEVPPMLVEIAVKWGLPVRGNIHPAELERRELAERAKSALEEMRLKIVLLQQMVADRDEQIRAQERQIAELQITNSRLDADLEERTSTLSHDETVTTKAGISRKYNSACKALYGVCKLHYKIDPAAPQGLKCAPIVSALAEVGVAIDDETFRKHLTIGSEQASK